MAGMHLSEQADLNPCFISTKAHCAGQSSSFDAPGPTLLSPHPPVVYDCHKVAGHQCELPGFREVPCGLHLHWLGLLREKE